MTNALNGYSKEKIRWGVLAFFLLQGLCFASWASRIPDIKDHLGVTDTRIWGLILFLIPVGKFLAIPLAGYSVSKFGSRIMVQISILGYGLALLLIGLIVALGSPNKDPKNTTYLFDSNSHKDKNE